MQQWATARSRAALDDFAREIHKQSGAPETACTNVPHTKCRKCPIPHIDAVTEHTLDITSEAATGLLNDVLRDCVMAVGVSALALSHLTPAATLPIAASMTIVTHTIIHFRRVRTSK